MQVSLAAANIDHIWAVVKKARHDVDKVDHDKVNPFTIIASFPSIKECVDQSNASEVQGIDDINTNLIVMMLICLGEIDSMHGSKPISSIPLGQFRGVIC